MPPSDIPRHMPPSTMAAAQGLMHNAPRHSLQLTGIYISAAIHVRTFAFSSPRPARASAPLLEPLSSGERMKEAGWPVMMYRVERSRCINDFFDCL